MCGEKYYLGSQLEYLLNSSNLYKVRVILFNGCCTWLGCVESIAGDLHEFMCLQGVQHIDAVTVNRLS